MSPFRRTSKTRVAGPIGLAAALLMAACAEVASPPSAPMPSEVSAPPAADPWEALPPLTAEVDYETLDSRAEREIKRAAQTGFLWLNTESYLAAARAARKAGDNDEAVRLARKALDEALLAQKQAANNANVKADYTYRR